VLLNHALIADAAISGAVYSTVVAGSCSTCYCATASTDSLHGLLDL
jgi:hypothetical protein